METRSIILKTALELYNELGVTVVTTRHIAAEMQISGGNLHYHFKHTDTIIQTLYEEMVSELDKMASRAVDDSLSIIAVKKASYDVFEVMYSYRFIFLDFVAISKRIPAIRESYLALITRREAQFTAMFEVWADAGLFAKDIPEKIVKALITQIFIVSDFWLSNNQLTLRLKGEEAVEHYSDVFFAMLYPYLTLEARKGILF